MDQMTPSTTSSQATEADPLRRAVVQAALQVAAAGYQDDLEARRAADEALERVLDAYVTIAAATAGTADAAGPLHAAAPSTFAELDAAGPEGFRAHQVDVLARTAALVASLPLRAAFSVHVGATRHEIRMQTTATHAFGLTDAEQVAAHLGLDQHDTHRRDDGHEYHDWYTGEYAHAALSIVLVTPPDEADTTTSPGQYDQDDQDVTVHAGTQEGGVGTAGVVRERAARFTARFGSTCPACDEQIEAGDEVSWLAGQVVHDDCAEAAGVHVYDPRGGDSW